MKERSPLPPVNPMPAKDDRRVSLRRRVLKNASIVFRQGYCSIRCRVLNLSESGALLEPIDPTSCPNEFLLKPDLGDPRHCDVAWRKDRHIAVRFVDRPNPPAALPARDRAAPSPGSERPRDTGFAGGRAGSIVPDAIASWRGALLVLSVAHMQPIPATAGPDLSGTVLDTLEDRLRSGLRGYDTLARLRDGCRFAIVLRDCEAMHVPAVAKRLIKTASSDPVPMPDGAVDVLLSSSVSIPPDGTSLYRVIAEELPELVETTAAPDLQGQGENREQPTAREEPTFSGQGPSGD